MRYSDIRKYTAWGSYTVDVSLEYLSKALDGFKNDYYLQMEPEFQRGHVWNQEQQIAFVEHILRGGRTSEILFNCPDFHRFADKGAMVLVDGLQRLTALLKFMDNKLPVFGQNYYNNIEDIKLACRSIHIKFRVNDLLTEKEVLQWYIDLNSGGTPHTIEELERVEILLEKCDK